jgi:hypothetical protein|tara:strand:- start:380 stop:595 length:216 start_codon:yes stop_codon:yes gene_type:complete
MNIWVEYWKSKDHRSHIEGSHAQMKENAEWIEPDPDDIFKRFCQNMEDAVRFARSMEKSGHLTRIKQDGCY